MTLKYFETFLTVCETMSMSAAADRLFVSQSAVSQSIRELEACYNVLLFDRLSRTLRLTAEGEQLREYAGHIVSYSKFINSAMRSSKKRKQIRLGTTSDFIGVDLMSAYKQVKGDVDILAYTKTRDEIEHLVRSAVLDAAILDGVTEMTDMASHQLMKNNIIFICNAKEPAHPAFSSPDPVITVQELAALPLIVRGNGCSVQKSLVNLFVDRGLEYNIQMELSSFDSIIWAVERSLGVGVISEKSNHHGRCCKRFRVAGLNLSQELNLIYLKKKYQHPEVESFIQFIKENIVELSIRFDNNNPYRPPESQSG